MRLIVSAVVLVFAACHGTAPTYSVSGNVSGSTVPFVVKLNGGNDISMSSDGSFSFTGKLLKGDTFNVQVVDSADRCTVSGGAGTVDMTDIQDVAITCAVQAHPLVPQTIVRLANLDGSQENPAVTTNAVGVGGVIVNSSTLSITGGVTFTGLTATSVGIFQAPSGNLLLSLTLAADGGTAIVPAGTKLLTTDALLAGDLYFEVRTTAQPAGEIRGQIQLQGGAAANVVPLDGAQVRPTPVATVSSGTGTLLADLATGKILVSYITHSANATSAGIHTGTGAGPTVVAFTNLQTGNNLANPLAGATMNAQNLADFNNNLLYFSVDTVAFPGGEIRGNISPQ